MIDGFGRKVNYLRLSITDLCNLRCIYCMPEEGVCKNSHSNMLRFEEITEIVGQMAEMGINKVRLTGGEPLVRRGIVSLVAQLKAIPGIDQLVLTTNGVLLPELAKPLKEAGLDRVNISIDSMKPDVYKNLTRGGDVSKVLDGIQAARDAGLTPIKLNVVLIKGINEGEIEKFIHMTRDEDIDVRFIELMPIGEVTKWNEERFMSLEEVLKQVPALTPVDSVDKASPATYYKLPGAKGQVGLIRPISCKFCGNCNRMRLTADGQLSYCLHSDTRLDLRQVLADKGSIQEEVEAYLQNKPREHGLEKGNYIKKSMYSIGG